MLDSAGTHICLGTLVLLGATACTSSGATLALFGAGLGLLFLWKGWNGMTSLASSVGMVFSSAEPQLNEHELKQRKLLERREHRRIRQRHNRQLRRRSLSGSSLPSLEPCCPTISSQARIEDQDGLKILSVPSKADHQGRTLMHQIKAVCADFPNLPESCMSSDNDDSFDEAAQARLRGSHAGMTCNLVVELLRANSPRLAPVLLEAEVDVEEELAPEPAEASHLHRMEGHVGGIMLKESHQPDENSEELDIEALDSTNGTDLSHEQSCGEA